MQLCLLLWTLWSSSGLLSWRPGRAALDQAPPDLAGRLARRRSGVRLDCVQCLQARL